ncbi:MAG: CopG family transcriptional regulator [Pseudomonadota bacterium]|jgi:hypothetical protein|nr:MAG: CopG family transcriptional regulator [Pseudomonadota bacterium]
MPRRRTVAPGEERTARLTLLIDPRKKQVFEEVCAAEDVTPSQVVRRMIREYIESRLGHAWQEAAEARAGSGARKGPSRRT